jgi:hypothetical protein
MVATVADALDRLKIVKAATEGEDGPLAGIEEMAAVEHFLTAVMDTYKEGESIEARTRFALAMNARALMGCAPILTALYGAGSKPAEVVFISFAETCEVLIDLHDEEAK